MRGVPAKDLCSGMTTLDGWVVTNLKAGLMYSEGYDQAEFMVLATLERGGEAYRIGEGRVNTTMQESRRIWFDGDEIVELGD